MWRICMSIYMFMFVCMRCGGMVVLERGAGVVYMYMHDALAWVKRGLLRLLVMVTKM